MPSSLDMSLLSVLGRDSLQRSGGGRGGGRCQNLLISPSLVNSELSGLQGEEIRGRGPQSGPGTRRRGQGYAAGASGPPSALLTTHAYVTLTFGDFAPSPLSALGPGQRGPPLGHCWALGLRNTHWLFNLLPASDPQYTRLDAGGVPAGEPLGIGGVGNAPLQLRGAAHGWDHTRIRRPRAWPLPHSPPRSAPPGKAKGRASERKGWLSGSVA